MQIAQEVKISENGFVFNSNTGDSFQVNPIGLHLISLLKENHEFDEIRNAFLEKYDVDELAFEKDFHEFCALLKHHQIAVYGNPLDFE